MKEEPKTKEQMAEDISRLEQRLGQFQSMVESSPDAICMTDARGLITYFSPGAEALSGYTAEEVLGTAAADFYPGGTEAARAVMRQLRTEGPLLNYLQTFIVKDDNLIEVYASFSLIHDANGEVSGTLAVWKDFTKQKEAEEALRETEDRYRGLLEDSQDAIGVVASDGSYVDVNQSWLDMIGATWEQLKSMKAADFYVDRADHYRLVDEMARSGSLKDFEAKLRRLDGREIYVQLNMTSRQASDGMTLNQAIARDITQRKWSEALEDVVQVFTATLDYQAVAQKVADNVCTLLGALTVNVFRLEGETGNLVPVSASGLQVFRPNTESFLSGESGISGLAVRERQAVVTPDMLSDPRINYTPDERASMERAGIRPCLSVPLMVTDRVIGTVTVGSESGRDFKEEDIALVQSFAGQAALALENARLLDDSKRDRQRSEALYEISNRLAGVHNTNEVLDLIVNEAARLVGAAAAHIRLLEGDVLVPGAATETATEFLSQDAGSRPEVTVEEGTSVIGHVMATKEPYVVEDAAEERMVPQDARITTLEFGFHGHAVVPLLANDRSIGVLVVADTRIRRFTEDEVSLLTAFADQASLALEKARLLSEAEREKERSDALYQISNQLAGVHDTDEVLDLIVNEAVRLVGATSAHIRLLEGEVLVRRTGTENALGFLPSVAAGEGTNLAGHVIATKKPMHGEEAANWHSLEIRWFFEEQSRDPAALAVVPLLANDRSIGVLSVSDSTHGRRFTDDEISLLMAFADQASLSLEKARLLSEAESRERQAIQLYEVTTQLASNHDLDSVLDLITQQAVELTGGRGGGIFKFDVERGGLVVATVHNMGPEVWDIFVLPGEGFTGRAYQERQAISTNDVVGDNSVSPAVSPSDEDARKIVAGEYTNWGVVGMVAAPIIIRNEVYGVLDVAFDQHKEFTDEEVNLVQNLADSAAVAINNARFIAETERARDEATQLYEITEQLASSPDMDSVLDLITVKATELLGSHGSTILRFDEAEGSLVYASAHNVPPGVAERYTAKPGVDVAGLAFLQIRPVQVRDLTADHIVARPNSESDIAVREAGLRAVLAVPVVVRDES